MGKVLFVGYATADIISGKVFLGGAAGVMAMNAAHLSIVSSLLVPLANDQYGRFYQKHLGKLAVDTKLCFLVPSLPTCIISNPHGLGSDRQWSDNGANAYMLKIKLNEESIQSFDGTFLANSHPIAAEKVARSQPRNLFYIPGPQSVTQKDYVRQTVLKKTRVVFGNEEEAPFIFEKHPFDCGVETVVITYGKKGGEVFLRNNQNIKFDSPRVQKVVDTTGAGDAFALGFGLALLAKKAIMEAIVDGKTLAQKSLMQKKGGLAFLHTSDVE